MRARGATLGAAAGLPFAVKDQLAVAGYPSTGGNGALEGYIPKRSGRGRAAGCGRRDPLLHDRAAGHECHRWPHAPDLRAQQFVRRGAQSLRPLAHSGREQRRQRRHSRRAHRPRRAGPRHQRFHPLSVRVLWRDRAPAVDFTMENAINRNEPEALSGRGTHRSAGTPARYHRTDGAHRIGPRLPRYPHYRRGGAGRGPPRGTHRRPGPAVLGA